MLQWRRHRDIEDRSLGDFHIKVAFLSECDVAATTNVGVINFKIVKTNLTKIFRRDALCFIIAESG